MHHRVSPAASPAASRARVRAKVLLATTCVAIAAVTLAACFDRTTAPQPSLAPVPRHDFLGDANWGANNSAASGSYDGTIDLVYGGAQPAAQALGPFVYPTFITANVSGQVRQVPGAVQGSNIVREAWSTNDPYFWGSMGFRSNGSVWWPIGPSAVLRVVAPIAPFRNDAGGQPTGDWNHCGWAGYALCWTWAGTAHFDFTRIHVDLTLARSPDTTVWQGTAATFTAGMSQTYFPGNPYPVDMSALQWRWISDSTASDSVACQSTSGKTCTHVFTSSGTMYAAAYVNGEAQQKSMHVDVRTPKLTLTAAKTIIASPGESDTFTPIGSGAVTVQGWNFTPDGDASAMHAPLSVGVMAAASRGSQMHAGLATKSGNPSSEGQVPHIPNPRRITSPAPARTSFIALPTHPAFSVAAGSSWGDCAASDQICLQQDVAISGTVEVIGTVNGVQLTASIHVTVIPCPTGNPVLDDPRIRKALKDLLNKSGPNLPPGDGIPYGGSVGNKREYGGNIYQRPNGTYYFKEDPLAAGTECNTARVPTTTPDSVNDLLVGVAHPHPTLTGLPVYGCPNDPVSGLPRKKGPWDTSTPYIAIKDADSTNGGGSQADWDALTNFPGNQGYLPQVDGFVINADGEVWQLSGLDAFRFAEQKRNRKFWKIKGNANPSCDW